MMKDPLIITPIRPGTIIAPLDVKFPRLVDGGTFAISGREQCINMSRAICQNTFMRHFFAKYEWVILMDSDVVVDADTLAKLLAAAHIGRTACVNTKGGPTDHVVCSCCVLHRSDYAKVDYLVNLSECQCKKLPDPFYVEGLTGIEVKYA